MANFKFRHTTIAADAESIPELTSDASMIPYQINDRIAVALQAFTENDNPDTSPHVGSITSTTLDDGRLQRVKVWSGFETQAEVLTYINYVYKDNPNRVEIAAWCLSKDTRNKYEILDNDNNVLQVLHDNTQLDQHTINGYVESPEDPFFIEA